MYNIIIIHYFFKVTFSKFNVGNAIVCTFIIKKLFIYWEELTFCKRDFWHHVETGNSVDAKGNRAFYLATGLTVEQAITPFLEFIKANNINVNLEIETAEQLLDNLDINQNIIEQYLV